MKKEIVTDTEESRILLADDRDWLALYRMETREKEPLGKKEEERLLGVLTMAGRGKLSRESMKVREARKRMVEGSLGLVFGVAWWCRNRRVDYKDLIGAGNIGLLGAVDKWKGQKGICWYTHACAHIRWAISEEIEQSGHLHVPKRHDIALLNQLRDSRRNLEDMGEQLHPRKIIQKALPEERAGSTMWQRAWSLLGCDLPTVSAEILDWEKLPICSTDKEGDENLERIEQWLKMANLTGGSRGETAVMSLLYGSAGDGCDLTYEEVGQIVGVSKQRVGKLFKLSGEKLQACVPSWANYYLKI